ncbi:NADPH-dependent FMN reductase [Brevibacillus panacihumi W25]|uniref:NADPH-dependent FMN reductase n=1 Tax=Brevibacillus panacihumi W25 TaxID=1408254 RepID=V6M212_9BACL|nr:NAD(P)H-dependent oxidoreductase [Brevibacillus panacihumi]EST52671.1 NADPH-dependent FMN reductase [Brevibacillus panacihumi W25]
MIVEGSACYQSENIIGSTRQGRNGEAVAKWVYDFATERNDNAKYELVDLADFNLPFYGSAIPEAMQEEAKAHIQAWSEKMASFERALQKSTYYL